MTIIDPKALALRVADLEEAVRLAEVGEYLFNARRYSYGDGYTEPREMGIDWQWQQSAPDQYGEGMLIAAATKWHDQQSEDGIITEARKLRDLRDALAAFLREAVEGPKVKPMIWAHDGTILWCYDKITGQRYGARNDEQKIAEENRRTALILSALVPPPARIEDAGEPSHDRR